LTSLEVAMTKGEILAQYKNLSPEDRRSFDRWLRGNAVVGSIFGVALVAMALGGLQTQETATAPAPTSPQTISVQELHGLAHLDNLRVDHIHNQALVFGAPEPAARSAALMQDSEPSADD
jgi:hypothetical protein